LYSFSRLFYRADELFQQRLFYKKLRFYYFYYVNKSLIKLEEVGDNVILPDQEVQKENRKIYFDKRLDIFCIGKPEFFNICSDMGILSKKDLFKSSSS